MKQKKSITAFLQIFVAIPLCSGIALTALAIFTVPLLSHLGVLPEFLADNSVLQAGVFPEPDEIPDGNLPQGNVESEFLPAIINILLALVSTITLGAMLVSGTLFIIHFGNEEKLTIAKGIFKWAIGGVVVILISYAIVQGVTSLTFNRT